MLKLIEHHKEERRNGMAFQLYRDGIFRLPEERTIDGPQFRGGGAATSTIRSSQRIRKVAPPRREELPVKLGENYLEIERVHGSGKGNAVAILFFFFSPPRNFSPIDYGVPMS